MDPSAASGIYIKRRDDVRGPFSLAQLKEFAAAGRLLPTDKLSIALETNSWQSVAQTSLLSAIDPDRRLPDAGAPNKRPPSSSNGFLSSLVSRAKNFLDETRRDVDRTEFLPIDDTLIIGRDDRLCSWVIHHPTVSRRHAVIARKGPRIFLRDLNSRTGVAINNTRIPPGEAVAVAPGDLINIGPAILQVQEGGLRVQTSTGHAHIAAISISKDVRTPSGQVKRILDNVSLQLHPSSFYVIIGPSGSGKSTLLHALNGRGLATTGDVLFNGENLYASYDALRTRMATVLQRDILHDSLTVERALSYTAALRLPADLTPSEKRERVASVIDELEIGSFSGSLIRTLSGGQTKRVSLGNELLSQPTLIFVDEATSGLDENSDRDIMQLLRSLADAGRTVVCITHNLGNVIDAATHVIVMAAGGHLAYVGAPVDALDYFSVPTLGGIYGRLAERPGPKWAEQYRSLNKAGMGQPTQKANAPLNIKRARPSVAQQIGLAARQARVVASRMLSLLAADKITLLVSVLQPACVAALILLVFGDTSREDPATQFSIQGKVLFLLAIAAFWLGCSNSAKEIVKEKDVYERERNSGLSAVGYLAAKLVILGLISVVQSVSLALIVHHWTGLAGSVVPISILASGLTFCGVSLGLFISTVSRNPDIAATAVPLAVIPQVILSGGVTVLTGTSEAIAMATSPTYWGFGGLTNRLYWSTFDSDTLVSQLLPMNGQSSLLGSLGVLAVFSVVLVGCSAVWLSGVRVWTIRSAGFDEWVKTKLQQIS